jgi:hypothetical protein
VGIGCCCLCLVRKKEGEGLVAAVGLIPWSASSWLQQLQLCMDMERQRAQERESGAVEGQPLIELIVWFLPTSFSLLIMRRRRYTWTPVCGSWHASLSSLYRLVSFLWARRSEHWTYSTPSFSVYKACTYI